MTPLRPGERSGTLHVTNRALAWSKPVWVVTPDGARIRWRKEESNGWMNVKRKRIARCPKCQSVNLILIELWKGHAIEFTQVNGVIDPEGWLGEGAPYCVWARCDDCQKEWVLRGVVQITDLPNAPQNKGPGYSGNPL